MSTARSPPAFFLLIFALSLPFLLFAGTPLSGPLNLPVSAFMLVCPALAAAILVRREEGARRGPAAFRGCLNGSPTSGRSGQSGTSPSSS